MPASYDWDAAKRDANLEKHQIDFAAVSNFDWGNVTIVRSDRHGETRFVAFGYIENRLHAVVYTQRGDVRRIISFRKASSSEVNKYG